MQSYMLVSDDNTSIESTLIQLSKQYKIETIDQHRLSFEGSIGIKDTKDIQKMLYLTPFKSQKKLIVIYDAQTMTPEAQNALLKVLEEPPESCIIILVTPKKDLLIPTILSRCTLIQREKKQKTLSQEELEEQEKMIQILLSVSIAKRFSIAQNNTKTKEDALSFLEKNIYATRNVLLQQIEKERAWKLHYTFLQELQQTYTIIYTTNINPRFALEQLFLSLEGEGST